MALFAWLTYLAKMLAALGLSVGGLALAGLYTFQDSLIYPALMNDGHGHCATPADHGMDYEDVSLTTSDGETLQCYALKHDPAAPSYTNKTVVILLPNAGNIGHALPIVALFYSRFGLNVFIYSYRGYGRSSGRPLEAGLKTDARRVMEYLACEDKQFLQSALVLYGRLLGGAVAVYMAATMPAAVRGLVLENTFLLIPKTVPHLFPWLRYFTRLVRQKWDSERLVPQIPPDIPVLLMSARRDEIVPPAHMDRILALLRLTDKTMHRYEQLCHNDTVLQPMYWERIHAFLRDKVPGR